MKSLAKWFFQALMLFSAVVGVAAAADESFAYQFLGSPLLILVVLIVVDALALLYHKIRK